MVLSAIRIHDGCQAPLPSLSVSDHAASLSSAGPQSPSSSGSPVPRTVDRIELSHLPLVGNLGTIGPASSIVGLRFPFYYNEKNQPWLVWLSGLSAHLRAKGSLV